MIPASQLKKTIDFNKSFRDLLEVLKLVAVSQYHLLEQKIRTFERIESVLADFFGLIDLSQVRHPFLNPGDKPLGVVAVTSDAGLLGGMNLQVMAKAIELVRSQNGRLVVVGDKGQLIARESGIPFTFFEGIVDDQKFGQAVFLRDFLTEEILKGAMGGVKIVFPRAISVVVHRIEVATLVPFSELKRDPAADAPSASGVEASTEGNLILESRLEDVAEYLVYLYLGKKILEIFGLSRLAEQAARFVHRKLFLQYFRRRHEMIDQNMRELFSARSLYVH